MSDEKVLTKEIAEQFVADEDSVDLSEFTAIEDDAAEVLSAYKGVLELDVSRLSNTAAESLSKHEGKLYLWCLTSLSDTAARSLAKHQGDLVFMGLTGLSDVAAKNLSNHRYSLGFSGLLATSLSDASIESLSKHIGGELFFQGLTSLSDAAAESLSKYNGGLVLDSLTEISDTAAESLCKHGGNLFLNGITELSDAAAECLSKHTGTLEISGLHRLEGCPGHIALAKKLCKQENVNLGGLAYIADGPAEVLCQKSGGSIRLPSLQFLSSASTDFFREYDGELDLDFDSIQGLKRYHVKHTAVVNRYTVYEVYAQDEAAAASIVEEWDDDEPYIVSEDSDHESSAVDAVWEPNQD